jgi:hypothetical protein
MNGDSEAQIQALKDDISEMVARSVMMTYRAATTSENTRFAARRNWMLLRDSKLKVSRRLRTALRWRKSRAMTPLSC